MVDQYLETAVSTIERARESGIVIRSLGAIAFQIHSPSKRYLFERFGREITDYDFVGYSRQFSKLIDFFTSMGYEHNLMHSHLHQDRLIFTDPKTSKNVDVFLDKLQMCHTIDLRKRLDLDFPTIPPSDLLLEKMQIVRINEKDIVDTIILLLEHEVKTHQEPDTIDGGYVSESLSGDWGFYYTVTTNLRKVKENFLSQFEQLSEADRKLVGQRIDDLLGLIERKPKSMGWKVRARIGTRQRWYRDVEEVVR